MPKRKVKLLDTLPVRLAVKKDRRGRKSLQSKRTMTLLLGAALSIGGVTQGFENVDFLIEKNVDQVQVIKRTAVGQSVVANVGDSFAANSLYKLAALAPQSIVARRSNLADASWFVETTPEKKSAAGKLEQISEGISLFNDEVREQFFKTSLPYGDLIHNKAEKYDVDPALVAAVMEAESRFKHRARSQVGAQGLMQLMPKTGRWMGARNLYDPAQNVDAGAKYLKYLQERFDGNLTKTIAAYNAGEGNVRRYNGVPPYRETRSYVKKVMRNYKKRNQQLADYKESLNGSAAESADLGR
jgi:soluble lytic murein transglycosylase-like protein